MRQHDGQGDGRHPERGAALAELTLVVSIMLTLVLVIFDFGQGFLAYVSVTNGARDGARLAIHASNTCTLEDLESTARNSSSPYDVTVAVAADSPAPGQCSVTVSYVYTPILPFVTSSFSLPGMGTIGPLWDGSMTETMVSQRAAGA